MVLGPDDDLRSRLQPSRHRPQIEEHGSVPPLDERPGVKEIAGEAALDIVDHVEIFGAGDSVGAPVGDHGGSDLAYAPLEAYAARQIMRRAARVGPIQALV